MSEKIVIVSAARTAIGSFGGMLSSTPAVQLGAAVVSDVLKRASVAADQVDEVILGHVLQTGLGQNTARQAAVMAGLHYGSTAFAVNKVCGSGLKAVALAAQSLQCDSAKIVIAGGMENMSLAPYFLNGARQGYRLGHQEVNDTILSDGLTCAFNHYHMGITAENIAEKYDISRQEQDEWALISQQRAQAAIEKGQFKAEIAPIIIKKKKEELVFDQDEYVKSNATLEGLAKLRPAFDKEGSVTAGNASGINDGAAALLMMKESQAKALGLQPLARIVSFASAGVDPALMGMGPVPATRKALNIAGLSISDIDLIEANEAFSAQFLAVGKELGFSPEKTNIHGGAIALGHPIGASGARILVTLLANLRSMKKQYGLATLCIGGGQGIAMIVEAI